MRARNRFHAYTALGLEPAANAGVRQSIAHGVLSTGSALFDEKMRERFSSS